MNKIVFLLLLFHIYCCGLISQNNDWHPIDNNAVNLVTKTDNHITYVLDSAINIVDRDDIIIKTKAYLRYNLGVLQESDFSEQTVIVFLPTRGDMHKMFGKRVSSCSTVKNNDNSFNQIICIYNKEYCPLNREMMKIILTSKWGKQNDDNLTWLKEGLANYACPEAENCKGLDFEESYAYLMQCGKLTDLKQFPNEETSAQYKIASVQAAYIVEYLLNEYGVEKLKQLWTGRFVDFEKIYCIDFNTITTNIGVLLKQKYRKPIELDWLTFTKDCIEPQPDDWLPVYNPHQNPGLYGMETKINENLTFTMTSFIDMELRNKAILETQKFIAENLKLIDESEFRDSLHIVFFRNRDDMTKHLGSSIGGMTGLKDEYNKENMIHCVYGKYNPLKHELMHIITMLKWGYDNRIQPEWLIEGLAVFANQEVYSCDGHTLEERYVYFLQNKKLLNFNNLLKFPDTGQLTAEERIVINKISYNQSAYIVSVLVEKYGIKKLKMLWQDGMDSFERIYGLKFGELIIDINDRLNKKYPSSINFNWEVFKDSCIE